MMRKILLVILLVLSGIRLKAQDLCGTKVTKAQIAFMDSIRFAASSTAHRSFTPSEVQVPVVFHIVSKSDGTGGLDPTRISSLLDEVNTAYQGSGISFFSASTPQFINSDNYYDFDASEEGNLSNPNDVAGMINIYVVGSLISSGTPLCGYAYFPPSADHIFLNRNCVVNEYSTTAHELGHYFTLYHTHGKTNNGTTDELVQRINCDVLGDELCDTPADPNLSGKMSGCTYVGTLTDANGDKYQPDTGNIMSYAPSNCRNHFSAGQLARIRNGLDYGRSYLNLVYPNFSARFTVDVRSGCAPLTVTFTDETSSAVSRVWEFQGANITSSIKERPTVVFDNPGTFSVTLTAKDNNGTISSITRSNFIKVDDIFKNVIDSAVETSFLTQAMPEKWSIINQDDLESFTYSDASVDNSGGSYFMDNFNYSPFVLPQVDGLITSNVDMEQVSSLTLSFNYAYTYKKGDIINNISPGYDTLSVGYMIDCDGGYKEIYRKGGADLQTAMSSNSFFQPQNDSEWKKLTFHIKKSGISNFDKVKVLKPVIKNISGSGNNLYIDNVSIIPNYSLDSVQFLRVSKENGAAVLRWFNPSVNETGVLVEKSLDQSNYEVIARLNRNAEEYIDSELPNNQPVYYRVANYNTKDTSSYSTIFKFEEVVSGIAGRSNDNKGSLTLYPNPVNQKVTLKGVCDLHNISSVKLYSLAGELSKTIQRNDLLVGEGEVSFYLENLPSGSYIIRIYGSHTCVEAYRLVKK